MSLTITAAEQVCQGYANCVVAADDVFGLGSEGTVEVLKPQVSDVDEDRVRAAAAACPVAALKVSPP